MNRGLKTPHSMVLVQASRRSAASLLPPLKSVGVPKALRREGLEEAEKNLPVDKA